MFLRPWEQSQRKQHFKYQPPFYFILFFYDFGSVEIMASLCLNGFSELNSSIECLKRKKYKLLYDFWAALEICTHFEWKLVGDIFFFFKNSQQLYRIMPLHTSLYCFRISAKWAKLTQLCIISQARSARTLTSFHCWLESSQWYAPNIQEGREGSSKLRTVFRGKHSQERHRVGDRTAVVFIWRQDQRRAWGLVFFSFFTWHSDHCCRQRAQNSSHFPANLSPFLHINLFVTFHLCMC